MRIILCLLLSIAGCGSQIPQSPSAQFAQVLCIAVQLTCTSAQVQGNLSKATTADVLKACTADSCRIEIPQLTVAPAASSVDAPPTQPTEIEAEPGLPAEGAGQGHETPDVVIYSAPGCVMCDRLKATLAMNNIPYTEKTDLVKPVPHGTVNGVEVKGNQFYSELGIVKPTGK